MTRIEQNRRMRTSVVLLSVLVLILALTTLAKGQVAEEQEFRDRWNEVGARWNEAAVDLQNGRMPRDKIARVDEAIDRLRRNRYWVRHGGSR